MNRNSLKKLATIRLKEAEALLATKNYSGAYYLSGYAVECALKACIAKKTKRYDFPDRNLANDSWTHNIIKLADTAGLMDSLEHEIKLDPIFKNNWNIIRDWSEQSRYQIHSKTKAYSIYFAITDGSHGVLKWIEQHW
ncbi:MAG: HEPN domain-containing protein [Candidatus Poribacteria bacterium]